MAAIAIVLAGGRGTRSADPSQAKLAQVIGGKTLMHRHLDLLAGTQITEVLVVAGHLGDQVQELCDTFDHGGVSVRVIQEDEQRGTVAALLLAADDTEADEFLVILGDILMSFPVDTFINDWRASCKEVACIVHPSTHPEDSDAAFPSYDGRVIVVAKSEPRDGIPNMSSTGLFAITREGLARYATCPDVGSDVLPAAAVANDLFAYVSSHYFKDTGTQQRLAAAASDVASGAFARRGRLTPRLALFLDRDGVLNAVQPEVYASRDYRLLPGVAAAISRANSAGLPVIVVTNQPGIAKGLMTYQGHEEIRAELDRQLGAAGAFVDDYFYCPHHPDAGFEGEVPDLKIPCDCRKPAPGMVLAAARKHHLDLAASVMVGDTWRDQELAASTGMAFVHAAGAPEIESDAAIVRGIERITC